MFGENPENVYFYITIYNEPYVAAGRSRRTSTPRACCGASTATARPPSRASTAHILASGVSMPEALRAADMLAADWDVAADVWSVTSWGELNRDGVAIEKRAAAPPRPPGRRPHGYVTEALAEAAGPGRRRVGLDARGARADPAVGARHLRHAGHRRVRLLRHPARPPGATSTPTPNRRWSRCWRRWPATARSTRRCRSRPRASTRSTTCRPRRSRPRTRASPEPARPSDVRSRLLSRTHPENQA